MEYVTLNNGIKMPMAGIGTFLLTPDEAEASVLNVLAYGYRLIDTANAYVNEKAVGRAMKKSGVSREEIFLETKLWPAFYEQSDAVEKTLERLDTDYIDLLLIHQPAGNYIAGYKLMEKAYKEGKVKAIGLSNFSQSQIREILDICEVKPVVLQTEVHPYYQEKKLKDYLKKEGIVIQAWYPLGHGDKALLEEPLFQELGKKYGKSSAQIILRWHIQAGNIVIPGSKSPAHIQDNFDLFDFSLTAWEMGIIFYRPLEALMGSFAMMNLANASLDNIAEINNLPTENEKQGITQFADTQADVWFENVSFSYDGKREAVSHVSFSANPGTITALVGPSGSGKSTLLNLILGFVTPKNGRILLNGKDAATLKHSDLVRHVSIVFQEVYLFQDTMMNNIRMGNQSATDEQVIEAAKKAHCHEFIEKLPQGYQTVISEGGASLSGGERQRVAIARAILKDSPIILLDEALSSLDAENAVAIQKGIEEMIKGKTVFLVSHTLSYIQNADQILVLSDGVLQGCGKHDELLQSVPLYKTMWEKEKSIKSWKL